jgi:hypothetical protein
MIIIGYCAVGFALGLGFVVYSIYTHRLMASGWPEPMKIPGMILTVEIPSSRPNTEIDKHSDRSLRTVSHRASQSEFRRGQEQKLRALRQGLRPHRELCRNHPRCLRAICVASPRFRYLLDIHRLLRHCRGLHCSRHSSKSLLVVVNLPCRDYCHRINVSGSFNGFSGVSNIGGHTIHLLVLHLHGECLLHGTHDY